MGSAYDILDHIAALFANTENTSAISMNESEMNERRSYFTIASYIQPVYTKGVLTKICDVK